MLQESESPYWLCLDRLNWQLHFGDPPKWSSGVKFILVDVEPSERDASKATVVIRGDAGIVAKALQAGLRGGGAAGSPNLQAWRSELARKVTLVSSTRALLWEKVA